MSYLESNLALLAKRQPDLARRIDAVSEARVSLFASASGMPSASYGRGEEFWPLHSRYDPLREARNAIRRTDLSGTDYFILLGFGLGYLLDALLEGDPQRSNHYFVVESDLGILRAAFEARDLTPILADLQVHFAWPVTPAELAEQWSRFFDPVFARKSSYVSHSPSLQLAPGVFKTAAEVIQSQIFQTFADINTQIGKSQEFLENFVRNAARAAVSPGVASFAGVFRDVPAVIVSAGPSLDRNLGELRGCEDRALILAADTAVKPLLGSGIDPHFILTGDPALANYLHLKGSRPREAYLVAEATSYPSVFDDFEGRTIVCTYKDSLLRSLSDLLGDKGTLRAWGSVATMALDFALLLGCNPVIFVGQDLAHTDGRIYCSGVYFEQEWFAGVASPRQWQDRLRQIRSRRTPVMATDVFGRPAESTERLLAYWNWIVKVLREHPEVRFVNATEGGILREGVAVASLRDALARFCSRRRDLRGRIRSSFSKASCKVCHPGAALPVLSEEARAVGDCLKRGRKVCRSHVPQGAGQLLGKLESAKDGIYRNAHLAPLLDCFNQMGNIRFLRSQREAAADISRMRAAYEEYFASVQEALDRIEAVLPRLDAELQSTIPPGQERRYVQGQRPVRTERADPL